MTRQAGGRIRPNFDVEVKTVSDAFNSSPAKVGDLLTTTSLSRARIVVPTFQRGYMWKKRHVEAFWQDVDKQRIQSRTRGTDPHFFGPIVTLSRPPEGTIWLLDGQQRLATATILFSVIRDVAREVNKQTGTQERPILRPIFNVNSLQRRWGIFP